MNLAFAIGLIAGAFLLLLVMSAVVLWHLTEPPPPAEEEMQDYLDFLHEMRAE